MAGKKVERYIPEGVRAWSFYDWSYWRRFRRAMSMLATRNLLQQQTHHMEDHHVVRFCFHADLGNGIDVRYPYHPKRSAVGWPPTGMVAVALHHAVQQAIGEGTFSLGSSITTKDPCPYKNRAVKGSFLTITKDRISGENSRAIPF